MIYQEDDLHWERPLTPELSKAFKAFCQDIKNNSMLGNYVQVSERGINYEDRAEVQGVGAFFPITSVQKVVEATFIFGSPCLRYIAYYTDVEKETGLFVLHYGVHFQLLCANYAIAAFGEEDVDAMLKDDGIPLVEDLMSMNFWSIAGSNGKESSLFKFATASATGSCN